MLEATALVESKLESNTFKSSLKEFKKRRLGAINPGAVGWFVYSGLGTVEGAMGAFPEGNRMEFCNEDTQAMKEDFESGIEEYNSEYDTTGSEYFYQAF